MEVGVELPDKRHSIKWSLFATAHSNCVATNGRGYIPIVSNLFFREHQFERSVVFIGGGGLQPNDFEPEIPQTFQPRVKDAVFGL